MANWKECGIKRPILRFHHSHQVFGPDANTIPLNYKASVLTDVAYRQGDRMITLRLILVREVVDVGANTLGLRAIASFGTSGVETSGFTA
jgi:hypothetical protein